VKIYELDTQEMRLVRELEVDGRKSSAELGRIIGTSKATAGRKLKRLLDERIISIVAVANPAALGYKVMATMGMKVLPGKVDAVADKLASYQNVHWVFITAGPYDIMIWALFPEPQDLSNFIKNELGNVVGLESTETIMNLEIVKYSYRYLGSTDRLPEEELAIKGDSHFELDEQDLNLIRELEADGRKSSADLGRIIGTSKVTASRKLKRLLDDGIITIAAHIFPPVLGYRMMATIGINVLPGQVDAVAQTIRSFENVHWVFITTGRYDIMAWVLFKEPRDLSRFVKNGLGNVPGLKGTQTMVNLEFTKYSYAYLGSNGK